MLVTVENLRSAVRSHAERFATGADSACASRDYKYSTVNYDQVVRMNIYG